MKIGDLYRFVKIKNKIEVVNMFEFLKNKRTTQLQPQSDEEKLSWLKAQNAYHEKRLKTLRGLAAEKQREKQLKKEIFKERFKSSAAGKAFDTLSKAREELQKRKGKGGFKIGINPNWLK